MKKFLLIVLLIASFVPVSGQDIEIMPDTTMLLPLAEGVETRWVLPPASPDFIARHRPMRLAYTVDNDGHVWLAFDYGSVLCPQKGYSFKLEDAFWDFVCLDNGVMLFATTSRLALLTVAPGQKDQQPTAMLQPIAMLPRDCNRMVKGADNCLYFICGKENGENSVWLFKPQAYQGPRGIPEFQKVFTSEIPISAVAGDGITTWIATGRMIMRVDGQKRLQRYYQHPYQAIVDLALAKSGQLFYATSFAAGYVGENGAIELFNTRGPRITCVADSLYLLFSPDYGVIALDGISKLRNYDLQPAGIKKVSAVSYDR
ncbi:MAG: hypothetical protein CVV42_01125 [Candidatus Riflebacteria bacterium HGW-Riflebacteria-2]|nr:MAG: hypothetical protein CVV42_01125 [Candidatus Riflebacteria bacterium HGW-Riflebacteria-2]